MAGTAGAEIPTGRDFSQPSQVSETETHQAVPSVIPDPEAAAKQARIKELEERFRLLSQSLGGMPTPPELKNKKISFGQKEEKFTEPVKKN